MPSQSKKRGHAMHAGVSIGFGGGAEPYQRTSMQMEQDGPPIKTTGYRSVAEYQLSVFSIWCLFTGS